MKTRVRKSLLAALALLVPSLAWALPIGQAMHQPIPPAGNDAVPAALQDVGIEEKLGNALPAGARFTAEDGSTVLLGDLVKKDRPTVIALVYYSCPMLCGLVLTGLSRGMRETGLALGKDFDALTISFDPRDTTRVAAERQRGYLQSFGQPEAKRAWRFLTGAQPDIAAVTDAVGFRYAYDERTKQYAHAAAIFVITPDGRVSRYLYGVEFAPRDLKLALVEASDGRVGTLTDQALLFCYHYDPETGKYGLVIMNIVRAAGAATVVLMAALIVVSLRRERRQAREVSHTAVRRSH